MAIHAIFQDAKRKCDFRFASFSSSCLLENGGVSLPRTGTLNFSRCPYVIKGVNFAFDSSKLNKGGEAILDQAAPAIKSRSDVRYEVAGHSDSKGTNAYSQALSERRAIMVYQGLVKRGVPSGQMTSRGYGETMPVANNKTEAGRAENRRVEINPVK